MRKNDIVIELVLGCERGGRMKRKALYLDDSEKELDALLENEDFWKPGGQTFPGNMPEGIMKDISTQRGEHTWNIVN